MTAISFTIPNVEYMTFRGQKRTTIRRYNAPKLDSIVKGKNIELYVNWRSRNAFKFGDAVFLGADIITNLESWIENATPMDIWMDGFRDKNEMLDWFRKHYPVLEKETFIRYRYGLLKFRELIGRDAGGLQIVEETTIGDEDAWIKVANKSHDIMINELKRKVKEEQE